MLYTRQGSVENLTIRPSDFCLKCSSESTESTGYGPTRATSSQISYRIYSIIGMSTSSTPSKGCVDSAVMKPLFCPVAICLAVAIEIHLWRGYFYKSKLVNFLV